MKVSDRRRRKTDRRSWQFRIELMKKYHSMKHLSIEDISKELSISPDIVKRISEDTYENH